MPLHFSIPASSGSGRLVKCAVTPRITSFETSQLTRCRRRKGRSRREAARVFGLKARVFGLKMCRYSAPPGFSALIGVLPRKLSVGDALILILAYCRIEVATSDCGPLYLRSTSALGRSGGSLTAL